VSDTPVATVLDPEGLAALFDSLAGRMLVGALDCGDGVVELVFSRDGDGRGLNLVTICTEGRDRGLVFLGSVPQPLDYLRAVRGGA